ncbi:hypothetical protein MIND_00320100 [Mycena indigotica]|uniref:ribonuclease Z n=1 Tax=Mycena indigotica TaxID=2126181 RepID=A0A8H6T0L2_9AGAR|nr:uncharacterized protein MIND_00320100 [Mycena indigotica]KAF7309493.1 hypothetical protein MIND_00320100 [Mycena indigotica]
MSWTTSVVTTATADTEPSVVLAFENPSYKYIFNVSENANRAFTQKKAHRRKTRVFFFTQSSAERMGGLAGMLMSSADQGLQNLDVIGPQGMTHAVASMRFYIYRNSMKVNVQDVPLSNDLSNTPPFTYQDKNITAYSFPIVHSSHELINPMPVDSEQSPLSRKRKREADPKADLEELMREEQFSPSKLQGAMADEWRKLMIKTMFPASSVGPSPPSSTPIKGCPLKKRRRGPKFEPIFVFEEPDQIETHTRPRIPAGFHKQLPTFEPCWPTHSPPALAYVVIGPVVRGKFDVEKSLALGVPVNRRSWLTDGRSIVVKVREGDEIVEKTVQPEDCIGPSEPPPVAIVLDVPSPEYVTSLVNTFQTSPFYAQFRSMHPADTAKYAVRPVFHLCGAGVLEDPRYVEFMNGFPPTAHHIISSREYGRDPITFTTASFNQLRLHQLDPQMFPVPHFSLTPLRSLSAIHDLPTQTLLMEPSLQMSVRPAGAPEYGRLPAERKDYFHPAAANPDLLMLSPSMLQKFAQMQTKVMEIAPPALPVRGADVQVIPLGTASAVPTSSRNVSSTLIRIPSRGSILLDAGEGTFGQLARHFGPELDDVLRDLRCIFVSHIHGDHHMGVAKILLKRRQLNPQPMQPLYLVSIHKLHLYLRELSQIEDLAVGDGSPNGVVTVISDALHYKQSGEYVTHGMWAIEGAEPWTDYERSTAACMRLCVALGLHSFTTIDVFHQVKCYGVCIRSQDGWSIVFSGDTLPTPSLIRGGKGATLLIHESTMGDGEEEMALCKAHSTVGQAIDIGRRMGAENILLTHFSARYPRLPPKSRGGIDPSNINGWPGKREPVVALAFDHLHLTLGTVSRLAMYLPVIQQAFAETLEEDDEEETKVALAADRHH